jgi:hypothetical protein
MRPYYLSMLGLVLDIAGAFLVAVEAIKLENLRSVIACSNAYLNTWRVREFSLVTQTARLLQLRPDSSLPSAILESSWDYTT